MRALTLTQPWAGLVASGIKLIENRPRSMIKREHFGVPFAIHASREIVEEVYMRIRVLAPELYTGTSISGTTAMRPDVYRLTRITGAVIAVATITCAIVEWRDGRIVDAHGKNGQPGMALFESERRWFFGPVGYVLRDVRALPTPVSCKGKLGFWTLPDDVAASVEEQLR